MTGQRARFPAVAGRVGHSDGTRLDLALARVRVAGRRSPWLANGVLCLDGTRHRLDGEVRRPGTDPLALELPGGAAYELGMRERDHGVPLQPFADG